MTCRNMATCRCGECGKMFSSTSALKEHGLVHSDVRKFRCHICDKAFKRSGECNRHVKEHSDVRNHKCGICDRRFKRKSSCNRHMDGHWNIKNFKCTKCGRGFAHYHSALSHEKTCCQDVVPISGDGGLYLIDNEVSDDEQMVVNETDIYTYLY